MKKILIKNFLFLIFFLMNKEYASTEVVLNHKLELEKKELEKKEKELFLAQLTEAEKNKPNKQKVIDGLIPIFAAIIMSEMYYYCMNTFGKTKAVSDETEELSKSNKPAKKTVFEKIDGMIAESTFGSYLRYCYNAIRFEDNISSKLNNSRMSQVCKDELAKSFLLFEQTEGTIFVDTFLTTFGMRKCINAVKKALRHCVKKTNNCIKSAIPIIFLICSSAYGQLQISDYFSAKIKEQTSKSDFLNKHPQLNKLTVTSTSVLFSALVLSPILENIFVYGLELCKEMTSDEHEVIKKAKCAKLCSEYIQSKDSTTIEENKEIYEAAKSLFIKLSFVNKIINNAIKFA